MTVSSQHRAMVHQFVEEPHRLPQYPSHRRAATKVGQRFGKLVVTAPAGYMTYGTAELPAWIVRCDCGNFKRVLGSNLNKRTRSCGCAPKAIRGLRYEYPSEYASLLAARRRCRAKNDKSYKNYGGRGISICERWSKFKNFLADMGPRPAGLSLDRINNDGNYEPSNCRWATREQQRANQRPRHINRWIANAGATEGLL